MARSLASIINKGIAAFPAASSTMKASGSFYQSILRFSTSVPNDPDTHEDFRPSNKVQNSGPALKDIVEKDVKENPVVIYMKGVPEYPQCGFSALAVKVLHEYNVPISARNILRDLELKSAVKDFSHWPTFPQIFINGEFVGGSDIILSMHQNGELKEKLKDVKNQKISG
ncbi:monothiol glutaredoxin-s15 mitochondrial [Phtheirospermum japonicum]|uniref:Monothiol glutaredoxin-s15 mitochondrial n=1 Tax=Phtheirospermum japonicum TaxID=374723 RepID=A0A830BZU9_9LAMI|nr:monothiol glutaredoxin-s15 mitochondrial [Phtheirospermum japonicum]